MHKQESDEVREIAMTIIHAWPPARILVVYECVLGGTFLE